MDGVFGVEPEFECLGEYSERLISFRKAGKVGFLTETGSVAVEPSFDEMNSMPVFESGLAAMKANGKMGFIEPSGTWKAKPVWDYCWNFHGEFALVESQAGYFVMDKGGEIVTRLNAYDIRRFPNWIKDWSCFRVLLKSEDKHVGEGCLNCQGKVVFAPIHLRITDFYNGIAGYSDTEDSNDALYGLVELKNRILVLPQFVGLGNFSQGLAVAALKVGNSGWVDEYGYIDNQGKWVIQPRFSQASPFSEDMALVAIGGLRNRFGELVKSQKFGFVNRQGEFVIDAIFCSGTIFKDGYAVVRKRREIIVLDKIGNTFWSGLE
jgi:hypothetical protein